MKITVLHCARCETDHEIEFRRFAMHPFEDSDGTVYDWWGLCPVTAEPVLLRVIDDKLPVADEQEQERA